MKVMGVDIEPGCKRHGSRCFSVVVVEDDVLVLRREHVSLYKLIRYIWDYRPSILATDNVYELAEDQRELRALLSFLPPDLEVVQVTLNPDGSFEDILSLARRYGLPGAQGKPGPLRTAYLAALLALRGQGVRVRFSEDKTHIVVSKSRSLGSGGMSQNRYMRRVRAAILRATRDIRKALDREGLDYDLVFRKSGGGLDSAVFIVYAPRKRLEGVVKPYEDGDVRIELRPVYTSTAGFDLDSRREAYTPKPYVIVGVDPGIVTGLAVIDLNGRVLYLSSRRGLDRQAVVEIVRRIGIPVLVATDVKPAPEYVKKLAASLHAGLYEPPEPLSVEEKREIVSEKLRGTHWAGKIDSHMRDALAAALKAYHYHESKLRQVESRVASMDNIYLDPSRIKADVIRGLTIAEAVEREIRRVVEGGATGLFLLRKVRKGREEEQREREREEEYMERIRELHERLEQLEAENRALRRRLEQLEEELEEARREYRLLRMEMDAQLEAERRITMLQQELETARARLEEERRARRELEEELAGAVKALSMVARGEALLASRLHKLGYEELRDLDLQPVVVADTLSPSLSRAWEKGLTKKIALVVLGEAREPRLAHGIPVLPRGDYVVYEGRGYALVKPEALIDAYELIEEEEKRRRAKEEKRELTVEDVKALFEEYRRRRAAELFGVGLEEWEG